MILTASVLLYRIHSVGLRPILTQPVKLRIIWIKPPAVSYIQPICNKKPTASFTFYVQYFMWSILSTLTVATSKVNPKEILYLDFHSVGIVHEFLYYSLRLDFPSHPKVQDGQQNQLNWRLLDSQSIFIVPFHILWNETRRSSDGLFRWENISSIDSQNLSKSI